LGFVFVGSITTSPKNPSMLTLAAFGRGMAVWLSFARAGLSEEIWKHRDQGEIKAKGNGNNNSNNNKILPELTSGAEGASGALSSNLGEDSKPILSDGSLWVI